MGACALSDFGRFALARVFVIAAGVSEPVVLVEPKHVLASRPNLWPRELDSVERSVIIDAPARSSERIITS